VNTKQESYNPIPEDLYQKLLGLAIQIADTFKIKLDYSNDSIKNVEKILAKLHADYLKTKRTEGLTGVTIEFAAYIIEVIRRNSDDKGIWYKDHNHFGEDSFPFVWGRWYAVSSKLVSEKDSRWKG